MVRVDDDPEYPMRATVVHLEEGKGSEEVKCKYILGCDGAHSDIRRQLGISNEGETTETHAGVLDALIRTNFASRKEVCIVQSDHAKTISMFPRENGLTRIFVHFAENEHEQRKEQYNRNKIQVEDIQREAKRTLLPHRIEFLGVLYWSVYVVGQRFSKEYMLQPGMRAPNFKVYSYATGKKTRVFDVVVKDVKPSAPLWLTFTLLVLASDLRSTVETVSAFLNETSKAVHSLPPMNVVVVTTSTVDQISAYKGLLDSDRVVIDKLNQAQCHRAYHRKTNTAVVPSDELQVVLVRPDGYIGTILRGDADGITFSNRISQYFANIA
ncbi:hypothetical protein RMCBS344292_09556 [Rhizopus microsporus]|nr:hypothetical protein RMCBS344292_09556 [Rhizopus microsporus]